MATKAYKASHRSGSSIEEEECTDGEEDDSSEDPIRDSRVRRRMPAAPTPPPSRQREEARSRVEQPDEGEAMDIDDDAELDLAKTQGIQDMLNAAATSCENAQIPSLLYTWDMSLVYFTLCAMRTLHDDCSGYRKQFCKALDTTIEQLEEERIKMVMPFPTRTDKTLPLSYPMPLKESRYVEFGTSSASRKASTGMEARYWQCVGAALRSARCPTQKTKWSTRCSVKPRDPAGRGTSKATSFLAARVCVCLRVCVSCDARPRHADQHLRSPGPGPRHEFAHAIAQLLRHL